jgi:hypothetical protein
LLANDFYDFRVRAAFFCSLSTTLFGVTSALSPPRTSRVLGSAIQGHARDRDSDLRAADLPDQDSRAALGNPQDKKQLWHTYSGRCARVATRPESQVTPPHIFNLPMRSSPPSHDAADRRLHPVTSTKATYEKKTELSDFHIIANRRILCKLWISAAAI